MVRCVPSGLILLVLLAISAVLVNCGGHSSSPGTTPPPNISGAWEFIANSSDGAVTGIEVALAEGTVLVNALPQPNGQITASGNQISFVSLNPSTLNISSFGGNCLPATTANSLSGTITAIDAPIQFTFTENGNVFNVSGTLSGTGNILLNGTYTAQTGNTCTDPGGTISGSVVSKLLGTYTGRMCPPSADSCSSSQDFTDSVTATVTQNSGGVVTCSLALTGTNQASFTLSGPAAGNAVFLQGTFEGNNLTYYGYFEAIGPTQNAVPSLYLVNATNSATPNYVGTLAVPPG